MPTTVLSLSHGGGPLPLLNDPQHSEMCATLKDLSARIPRPSVVLLISAHWEEEVVTITSSSNPPLIYDYYGFAKEAYDIKYPARGHPEFAQRLHDHMTREGIQTRCSESRGFDHGVFVPMKIMYPNADIPCVQLSLVSSLDPKAHIEIGRAIQNYQCADDENLLVIGSGFSFHNINAFFDQSDVDGSISEKNIAFESWLQKTITCKETSEENRENALLNWDNEAPSARFCHPREEHLLPLHVCYGATGRASDESISLSIMGKRASMFLWNAGI